MVDQVGYEYRIEIDRGFDKVVFHVRDSTLSIGDTVKFSKGVIPMKLRIENENDLPEQYYVP